MSTLDSSAPDVQRRPVRRALLSVSDKTGLADLATGLHGHGVAIVSTGSTAAAVAAAGVPVTPVEELTGFPECLGGRVKTLHPRVHAGILADPRDPDHVRQLAELGVEAFELVVVNLYPFEAAVASGAEPDECVEQIDVGGPSMVRAAAKNSAGVAVVTDPADYTSVLAAVAAGGFTLAQRRSLAARAFAATAAYDVAVASWWANSLATEEIDEDEAAPGFPDFLGATWRLGRVLRYGENPHQSAAVYVGGGSASGAASGLATAEQLHGKEMSYNNYVDADAARRAACDFDAPAVAVVKHANPCGIAVGEDVATAHARAHACDPTSAFGGVVAANRPVSVAMAEQVAEVFTEVVVAPGYEPGALDVLTRKKAVRVLRCPLPEPGPRPEWRAVSGGLLLQDADALDAPGDDPGAWRLVAGEPADDATLADLVFAWRAVRAVRSNAVLLAAGGASVGVGMGQVNRVDSCRLAVARAGQERARGAAAASDAFFPFADGLQVLLDAGVRAVVQPGGSVRDEEVVAAARAAGAAMYLTGARHFAH
ncbi:bifunctional phosphoribosylaminoimidazolecarboxamide formyltransferase/IMP cyclohydrolase [Quadrisphaera sp. DSM 44207]|uniref:bifunctional phosphoribosylaminoimidazolecarboxamide formyltransferase/IMP cyclohydrolase n=1 Tax=Quadrisphaera sp. DSM 44207 TaxID=1881057 RepID=UPI00087E9851|nr:bifunctional phosphoribosylaminoimidazolecarboxamide formyltransferase/IMP cyclohydrolase [Quadrisphaera sp. DSM 44207]SDQ12757.1 IMP cyclohydrolase /phosphoribosylaminoimidazolecarboxamide formyltransferase [Quadrisphaera sp. DSM 44207]